MSATTPRSDLESPESSIPDYPEWEGRETLSLEGLRKNLDVQSVKSILGGGRALKEQVKRCRIVRILTANQEALYIKYAPTEHTDRSTSLGRMVAAAGIWAADHKQDCTGLTNSLAEAHGLGVLKTSHPELYWLYNTGLEYELEYEPFRSQVVALLGWRTVHSVRLLKKAAGPEDFTQATVHFEKICQTDQDWEKLSDSIEPYTQILVGIKPRATGSSRTSADRPRSGLTIRSGLVTPMRRLQLAQSRFFPQRETGNN